MRTTVSMLLTLVVDHREASEHFTPTAVEQVYKDCMNLHASSLSEIPGVQATAGVRLMENSLIDKICFNVCNVIDSSEVWAKARQDPDAFRLAVKLALGMKP